MANTFLKGAQAAKKAQKCSFGWEPFCGPSNWQTLGRQKAFTLGADAGGEMETLTHSCGNYAVAIWESHADLLREMNGPAILLLGKYFRESLIHVHIETCPMALHVPLSLPGPPSLVL